MIGTFFPERRFFEYDRHAIFTYELVNEVNRLTKKENMHQTTALANSDIAFVEKVSELLNGEMTHEAIKKQYKGMIR